MINVRRFGVLHASSILVNTVAKTMSTGGRLQQSKLEGKVAIVTASTEGIGFAIARSLGENGAKVIVSSRKEERVMNAVKLLKGEGLEVRGTVCHVGKAEDRKKLVDLAVSEYGGLDILVSNAGTNPSFGPILDTPESSWDKIFDTNVKAPFLLTKECMPHLEKKGGSIVIVASIAGYQPLPGLGAYSVSKTALLGLTRTLASELGPRNVRVNCIAPGIIKTAFSKADGKNVIKLCGKLESLSFHKLWSNDSIKELVLQQVPLGRLGESSDCGGLAVFLCSDDAKYITGETIPVTGGMVSRL